MRRSSAHALLGLCLANGLAAALLALVLGLLTVSGPATAQVSPRGAAEPAQQSGSSIAMHMAINTGTGDNSIAYNGSFITYTLSITNVTASPLSNILVLDYLPQDTLTNLKCSDNCEHRYDEEEIPEPLGGTLVVTVTRQLSWTVASLAPGAVKQLVFSGRVTGQADGTVFENRAIVPSINGQVTSAQTQRTTTVRLNIAQTGQPGVAAAPTWFSADLGGTLSQDWGDFNNDGYLDLALGSSIGTTVYRNENGRLKFYWRSARRASYGVRWADFNGDGQLDLVAVGESPQGNPTLPGINYLYTLGSDGFTELGNFASDFQLVRVAAGDFDGDGHIDIIGSTNTINAACPVVFYRNNGSASFSATACISGAATAAIGPGDVDNDGDLDLALGLFPNTIAIYKNNGSGVFNSVVLVDDRISFLPYDFAWGDYDSDGDLDIAAAFPLQKEARIYRNFDGSAFDTPVDPFRTALFLTPLAVDWGDFNGDGKIDLLVADEAPKVYLNQDGAFDRNLFLATDTLFGQAWSIRGAQVEFGGDLNLVVSNRDNASLLFDGFAAHLDADVIGLDSAPASSVAWGDADGDTDLDLLLGAGSTTALGTNLYYNISGTLGSGSRFQLSSGPGPHSVTFADVSADGKLDIAVGTAVENQIYLNESFRAGNSLPSWTAGAPFNPGHILSWGDANSDGKLDLLVGANGSGATLFLNHGTALGTNPVFATAETGDIRDLAWADYNQDFYMDFAVAFYGQPVRVYRNNKDNTFTPVWNSGTFSQTTSLAWADFNADGYLDLAIGHYAQGTQIFENLNATLSAAPVWTSPTRYRTRALAWGDWDNDGYPELAIGNDGDPVQVFANLGSFPGSARLFWLWSSNRQPGATGLAWGDYDGDGDLDLALSQNKANEQSGYYKNGTITPSHLASNYVETMVLPNNPSYLAIQRPGKTSNAYRYSASEILGSSGTPTVTIRYTLYDPDGTRTGSPGTFFGDSLVRTYFEFSLDGGSTWRRASAALGSPPPITTTTRTGQSATFIWDALRDQAISDDARFRIRIVPQVPVGPVQRASTIAVSPPFRVRATSCIWPEGAAISILQQPLQPLSPTTFIGSVLAGSGQITYTWNFGDGTPLVNGQAVNHTFANNNTYTVTLTVSGQPCPKTRPAVATKLVVVGTGIADRSVYLPLITNGTSGSSGQGVIRSTPSSTVLTATATVAPTASPSPSATATETEPLTPTSTATSPPVATSTDTPEPSATSTATPEATATSTDAATATSSATSTSPAATETATAEPEATATVEPTLIVTETPATASASAGRKAAHSARLVARPGFDSIAASQLMPLATTISATQVTNSSFGISNAPSLNRDGTRVAFWSTADLTGENADGNIEVFLATLGSPVQYTQLTHSTGSILGGFNLSPSIDGSGTRVAFFSDRDLIGQNPESNFEVYLYDTTTLTLTQVTSTTRGFSILPHLGGSGRYIVFASDGNFQGFNSDGNTEIFRAEIGAAGAITITQLTDTTGGVNDQPKISDDGRRVVFISNHNFTGQNNESPPNREIFVALLDASGQVSSYIQVSNTTDGNTGEPAISGDGRRIAFVSDRDPEGLSGNPSRFQEIFYADINDAGILVDVVQATVSQLQAGNNQPWISADGTRITYISQVDQIVGLYDTLLGSQPAASATSPLNPSISADGTTVAFAANQQIYLAGYPLAEITVSKTADISTTFPGDPIRYTVVVSNAGPSPAHNVLLTDVMQGPSVQYTQAPDQTDDAGADGFAQGTTFSNTTWDAGNSWLTVNTTPMQWPLPDNGASGWTSMADNSLLLHLDEAPSTGTFADTSGYGHSAACDTGLGTCPTNTSGLLGTAQIFDGFDDRVSIPNHAALDFDSGESFSLLAWIKTSIGSSSGNSKIIVKRGFESQWYTLQLAGRQQAGLELAAGVQAVGGPDLRDGSWHQLVGVVDRAAGTASIYVDGVLRGRIAYSGNPSNSGELRLGYYASASEAFNGQIDEVAIFGRALSSAEVAKIYEWQAAAYSGFFESRVMDAGEPLPWSTLAWQTQRPHLKPLPDNAAAETAYADGNVSMSSNAVLLHFDEAAGATSFDNTGGSSAIDGTCTGTACPTAGVLGKFNTALAFDGGDFVNVQYDPSETAYAVSFWFRTTCSNCGLFSVGSGQLGSVGHDRHIYLNNGQLHAAVAGDSTISASGTFTDGRWHHVVHTLGGTVGAQRLYVDGQQVAVGSATASIFTTEASLNVGFSNAATAQYLRGDLDEVAVFSRALSSGEVSDLYQRGAVFLRFQVRSCDDAACAGEIYAGPGGDPGAYYSEEANPTADLPVATLTGVPDNRYFQYRAWLGSLDASGTYLPRLQSVTAGPTHGSVQPSQGTCGNPGSIITCALGTLAPNTTATLTVIAEPTAYGVLSNTAYASTSVTEHFTANADSEIVTVQPVELSSVTISGPTNALAQQVLTFQAVADPIYASTPITFVWQATNQPTYIDVSADITSTVPFTWVTGGNQSITVTAMNAGPAIVTDTHSLGLTNPVPQLDALVPPSTTIRATSLGLTLNGSNFVSNSAVEWNGSGLSETYVNSSTLSATVPAGNLGAAGVFTLTVINPLPGGGTSNPLTFTVNHPTPIISSTTPANATAGGQPFSLTVRGANFYPGAILYWNGAARPTTVNTTAQVVTVTVAASDISVASTAVITVANPSPSTGPSAPWNFVIANPTLTLTPASLVMGINQTATMTVTLNAAQASNRVISLTSTIPLTAIVPPTVIVPAGSLTTTFTVTGGAIGGMGTITAELPPTLGGGSDSSSVTVRNPKAIISSTNPVAASAGGITFTLTVNGADFVPGASLRWNNAALTTYYVSSQVLTASIDSDLISTVSSITLTVANPLPRVAVSDPFTFEVEAAVINLAPANLTIPINSSTVMTVSTDSPRAQATSVTLLSSSTMITVPATVTIPPSSDTVTFTLQTGNTGANGTVTASLPAGVGGDQATAAITVTNPLPNITQLSPDSRFANQSGNFQLTVFGSGFVADSVIYWNGSSLGSLTFVSGNEVRDTVNSSHISGPGYYTVTVFNPAPPVGGQFSNVMTFTVYHVTPTVSAIGPTTATVGGPAFTLYITGSNFYDGAQVHFDGQARAANFISSSNLTAAVGSSEIDVMGTVYVSVTNPAPSASPSASLPFTITPLQVQLTPAGPLTMTLGSTRLFTATLSAVQATSTVITLTSTRPDSLLVPNTVSVPAGQILASFTVTAPLTGVTTSNAEVYAQLPTNRGVAPSNTVTVAVTDAPITGLSLANSSPHDVGTLTWLTASVSSGTGVSYIYNYGNGVVSLATPVTLTTQSYASGGYYTAVVTATNSVSGPYTATTLVQVNHLTPTLSAVSPVTLTADVTATLRLTGTNFVNGSLVRFRGTSYATQVISSTVLTVTLPPAAVSVSGTFTISVVSPVPPVGGRESLSRTVWVVTPLSGLAATSSSPTELGQSTRLTATASGDYVTYIWNFGDGSPTGSGAVVNHTYPTDAGDLYTATVTASNPVSGPYVATTTVQVNNPQPAIGTYLPMTGTSNLTFTLTITGSNFIAGAEVRWRVNSTTFVTLPTTVVNSALLTVEVPASAIPNANSTYNFRVVNPAPPAARRESDIATFWTTP